MNVGTYRPILAFNMNPLFRGFKYLSRQLQALKSRGRKGVSSRDMYILYLSTSRANYQRGSELGRTIICLHACIMPQQIRLKEWWLRFSGMQHIIIFVYCIADIRVYLYVSIGISRHASCT